jgi:hypothetical protein
MMTLPSNRQLLELIRGDLARLEDMTKSERQETLGLVDGLLGSIAERAEHEVAWMYEEIEEIQQLALSLMDAGLDPKGTISQTYWHVLPVDNLKPPDLLEQYHANSELLGGCVALAMTAGGEARARLDRVIDTRVAHERQIRGDLALVGRG